MKKIIIMFCCLCGIQAEESPIFLWSDAAPGSEGKVGEEVITKSKTNEISITNVHRPSITPYFPKEKKSNAAVIIAPGGGHRMLCMTHEGTNVAQWLAENGVTAFVLKYRLAKEENSTYTVDGSAVVDMQRAITVVRGRAKEWNLDSNKIGVMGFSAGGEVCAMASINFSEPKGEASSRPDFQALIYPGHSERITPSEKSPPAFLAASANDRPDISEGLPRVYLDFKKAHVPVELHLYGSGGHGFGLRASNQSPEGNWIERFQEWMIARKLW